MNAPDQTPPVWLRDPYLEWTAREGVAVVEEFRSEEHTSELQSH